MDLTYKDYPFLNELGLKEENFGVYNGEWFGSGPIITSTNPSTGKPIARIKGASLEDYEACIKKMNEAKKYGKIHQHQNVVKLYVKLVQNYVIT